MKQATQNKYTQMTTAPIPSLIGKLAIPTIVSMLITSFYVMADTYFVGKINTHSTAAVGISFSIMAIIQAFVFSSDTVQEIIFPVNWEHKTTRALRKWHQPVFSMLFLPVY
jgi:Na+-driven multidrug efflux pump